jgi:folylpolyglutamate synthase/dihydropteroate synthase
VTRASNSRAASIEALETHVADRGCEPRQAASVAEAVELALHDRAPIIVAGSLFTVADAREEWFRRCGILIEHD